MAKENQTRPTLASVLAYLNTIEDPARRKDCETIGALMQNTTGFEPVMWGPAIIGFGSYHYKYDSGREGDAPLAGFSSRKGDLTLYVLSGAPQQEALLARLGKHKASKACVYIKRASDIDLEVLAELIRAAIAETRKRYP